MKGLIKNPEGVHLNESRFRSYEPIIGEFLSTYPDLFVFSPTNRSLATVTSALRAAINAVLVHNYNTTLDIPKLREIWPRCQVTVHEGKICIGTREARASSRVEIAPPSRSSPSSLTIDSPSEEVLNALSVLFLSAALTDPILLTGALPHWSPPLGVIIQPNGDDTYTML